MRLVVWIIAISSALSGRTALADTRVAPEFLKTQKNTACHFLLEATGRPAITLGEPESRWGDDLHHDEDMVSLWNLLVVLERSQRRWPKVDPGKPFRVLNLAASLGRENYALSSFFGSGRFLEPGGNTFVASIDLNADSVRSGTDTQERLRKEPSHRSLVDSIQYAAGDAGKDETFRAFPGEFDFALIRHPKCTEQLVPQNHNWVPVIRQALKRLKPGGFLLLTSYDELEIPYVMEFLEEAGARIVTQGDNPFSDGIDGFYFLATQGLGK